MHNNYKYLALKGHIWPICTHTLPLENKLTYRKGMILAKSLPASIKVPWANYSWSHILASSFLTEAHEPWYNLCRMTWNVFSTAFSSRLFWELPTLQWSKLLETNDLVWHLRPQNNWTAPCDSMAALPAPTKFQLNEQASSAAYLLSKRADVKIFYYHYVENTFNPTSSVQFNYKYIQ